MVVPKGSAIAGHCAPLPAGLIANDGSPNDDLRSLDGLVVEDPYACVDSRMYA